MPAYLYNAPAGFPGGVSRPDESNIEPVKFAEADCPAVYGYPVVFEAGVPEAWDSGDAAVDFAGIIIREVPAINGDNSDDESISSGGVPNFEQTQGLLVRGYMMVKCWVGTPARNGVVYVQSVTNGGIPVGAFRADGTDSGNAVALTNAQASWAVDGIDANKSAEIRVAR